MFARAIWLRFIVLLALGEPAMAQASDPRLAANTDLTKVVPPEDVAVPSDATILGYHFWPTNAEHILLGPFNANQDSRAKQKIVVGHRAIYLYVLYGSPVIAAVQQIEAEIQQAGGGIAYQCDGQACGFSNSDIKHACSGVSGWFIKDSNDPLYSLIYSQEYPSMKVVEGSGFSIAQSSQIGIIPSLSNINTGLNAGVPDQASTQCSFVTGLIPAGPTSGARYVSLAAFNDPANSINNIEPVYLILDVIEDNAVAIKTVNIDADALGKGINTQGHIALYGIYFDFDKSIPKQESNTQIGQIAELLKASPSLKVLIVGHTDNQGGYDYNVNLSLRRAQSVVDALAKTYHIDASRLKAAGDGMTAPVATNTTEQGRAKNRRVELVAQ